VPQLLPCLSVLRGTAVKDTDYSSSANSITIAAGLTTGSVTLTSLTDTLDEDNETIIVDITSVTNATESGTQQVTTSITDNDAPPSVTLGLSGSTLAETGGSRFVNATLSAVSGRNVSVQLTTSGTASGGDFSLSSSTIVVPAGSSVGSVTLTATSDTTDEPDETVIIDIASVTNGTEGSPSQDTATIVDDDAPPTVTLTTNVSSISEASGSATITATLSAASAFTVTVNLGFTGIAVSGTDYNASGSSITITAGQTTGTRTITAINDTIAESDESVVIDITSVTNGTESGTQQRTVNITDNDPIPSVTLSLSPSSASENGGIGTVTATLSNQAAWSVIVQLAYSGTATSGSDYSASATSISIHPGNNSGAVTITGLDDTRDELNETVVVDISSVTSGTESGTQRVTFTLNDDDPTPTVTLSVDTAIISENSGTAIATATLSAASNLPVTVNLGLSGTCVSGRFFEYNGSNCYSRWQYEWSNNDYRNR
jgi:hypothetical protein